MAWKTWDSRCQSGRIFLKRFLIFGAFLRSWGYPKKSSNSTGFSWIFHWWRHSFFWLPPPWKPPPRCLWNPRAPRSAAGEDVPFFKVLEPSGRMTGSIRIPQIHPKLRQNQCLLFANSIVASGSYLHMATLGDALLRSFKKFLLSILGYQMCPFSKANLVPFSIIHKMFYIVLPYIDLNKTKESLETWRVGKILNTSEQPIAAKKKKSQRDRSRGQIMEDPENPPGVLNVYISLPLCTYTWWFPESSRGTPSHHPFSIGIVPYGASSYCVIYPHLWKPPHNIIVCIITYDILNHSLLLPKVIKMDHLMAGLMADRGKWLSATMAVAWC